jgi:hypothetical protein
VAAASAGGWLWAVSCPAVSQNGCRPVVERMRLPGGTWIREPLPAPSALPDMQLTVLSGRAAVVVSWGPHPALVSTTDGGTHWSVRPPPAGPPIPCGQDPPGSFTAASPDNWWLLCVGGAAAGSSTKALWRSADAGRTWTVVSAIASLAGPRAAGSLPSQDGAVIAAGSAGRLWIVTPNTISVSTDGGASWSTTQLDPQGFLGQFDVLSSTLAWVLAPGAGLWQTTDGITWRPVGGAGPLTPPGWNRMAAPLILNGRLVDVLGGEVGVLGKDLSRSHAVREHRHHRRDREAQPPRRWPKRRRRTTARSGSMNSSTERTVVLAIRASASASPNWSA